MIYLDLHFINRLVMMLSNFQELVWPNSVICIQVYKSKIEAVLFIGKKQKHGQEYENLAVIQTLIA